MSLDISTTGRRRRSRWDLFVPRHLRATDERRRARLVAKFGAGFGFFNMGFTPFMLALGAYKAAVLCLIWTPLMAATPLILRFTGSLRLSANILIGATVGLFATVSFVIEGLSAPTMPVLGVVPLLALFLVGRTAGWVWTTITVIIAMAYFVAGQLDYRFPPPDVAPAYVPLLRVLGLATLVTVGMIFILQYERSSSHAIAVVKRANRRMRTLIRHLDATSASLSQSAAEFLGGDPSSAEAGDPARGDPGDTAGLTQRMLSTANSSRQMIGGVGASIRGMIAQYKSISTRIHELHQQTGTINELVEAIDSVSDRLDLMALNTGIEAAHAGESGRRFRLLAEDMRRLAERVLNETYRIKASLRRVQTLTQAAIDASAAGQALTDEGTVQLEAMSRAFDEMHTLIERTADASGRITRDTITQLATIHSLVTESIGGER